MRQLALAIALTLTLTLTLAVSASAARQPLSEERQLAVRGAPRPAHDIRAAHIHGHAPAAQATLLHANGERVGEVPYATQAADTHRRQLSSSTNVPPSEMCLSTVAGMPAAPPAASQQDGDLSATVQWTWGGGEIYHRDPSNVFLPCCDGPGCMYNAICKIGPTNYLTLVGGRRRKYN